MHPTRTHQRGVLQGNSPAQLQIPSYWKQRATQKFLYLCFGYMGSLSQTQTVHSVCGFEALYQTQTLRCYTCWGSGFTCQELMVQNRQAQRPLSQIQLAVCFPNRASSSPSTGDVFNIPSGCLESWLEPRFILPHQRQIFKARTVRD